MGRTLVTGAMGCLGAWTLAELVRGGHEAVSFDLSTERHRLDLVHPRDEQEGITFVTGDLTDAAAVRRAVDEHEVEHVIHLGALQIPACRADPALGARVNVLGTVHVFAAARAAGVRHVAYASSLAVHGPADATRLDSSGRLPAATTPLPGTHYGVFKLANEGTARVEHLEHGTTSIGLRPYTVYGPGRDQGLTSEPTKAMLAAAAGRDAHISFGGAMQFHYAPDVARLLVAAAHTPVEGALVFDVGGDVVEVAEVARLIGAVRPGVRVTCGATPLPLPPGVDEGELASLLPVPRTTLRDGIEATVRHFEVALGEGRIAQA